MDFIDWCSLVLNRFIDASQSDPQAWHVGVGLSAISEHFFQKSFHSLGDNFQIQAIDDAVRELQNIGFIAIKNKHIFTYEVTQFGIEAAEDLIPVWESICSRKLNSVQESVLKAANSLSEKPGTHFAWLEYPKIAVTLSLVGGDKNQLWSVAKSLEDKLGFLSAHRAMGSDLGFRSTYRGLVWTSRRGITFESKRIDALVKTWETTSVDFKRELFLDTASQKAEFVKDILGLANTQSSPPRLLIIGFDNKTRNYYSSPDPRITQDRIEHILRDLTSPMVIVRYEQIEYRSGTIGQIAVIREAEKLPYRVRDGYGFMGKGGSRIEKDQIFVRHGTHTEEPTPEELKSIIAEGDRARGIP
jgi:hypothetical protein